MTRGQNAPRVDKQRLRIPYSDLSPLDDVLQVGLDRSALLHRFENPVVVFGGFCGVAALPDGMAGDLRDERGGSVESFGREEGCSATELSFRRLRSPQNLRITTRGSQKRTGDAP